MNILYVGETWNGSSARSMREALKSIEDIHVDDVGEDHYFSKGRTLIVRGTNRLLRPWHRAELERELTRRMTTLGPDVFMAYKGAGISAEMVARARRGGALTVNIFPDCSPHAHGKGLREAIGEYDLVISTKPFHPPAWKSVYGYNNRCVCVPHGYDPFVHYWASAPKTQDFDIVLAATWRLQYETLLQQLAASVRNRNLRVGVAGAGWTQRASKLPGDWSIGPELQGRSYGEWVRRGKIVIAPLHRVMHVNGVQQPGDVDTTRTYNLAAAGCFFVHRRTPYVETIYDETTEVPLWEDANELSQLIGKYLPLERERRDMAARAHARAVPKYSIIHRAHEVLTNVRAVLNGDPR